MILTGWISNGKKYTKTRGNGPMTKREAIKIFEQWAQDHACDFSPATLRTCWNDYTDSLSKNGHPKAYNWIYPKTFTIGNRKYRTE
jgi:hypothetical protein